MNKKTKALTTEQYKEIIQTMREGFSGCRPNERIATALVLEGNLGLRISDVLKLRPRDIVRDGDRYRLEVTEQKTGQAPCVHGSACYPAVYRELLLTPRHRQKCADFPHHRASHSETAPYRVRLPGL